MKKSIGQELAEETFRELGMGRCGNLRESAGGEVRPEDLTYEIFVELINKTDYLLGRTVAGLQEKVVKDEKTKINKDFDIYVRKYW